MFIVAGIVNEEGRYINGGFNSELVLSLNFLPLRCRQKTQIEARLRAGSYPIKPPLVLILLIHSSRNIM